ncbi:DNA repair protein RAD51 homolog 4-like [Anopheles darlingi]|uniref:DNA repair protein RAD51 homolog 4-like n=1 Tax=Anopheles darlingi TaxID=43151 RepID=UPI0021001187|nr:DNA repair protein RAD51 homolog 4-like [Anopheles darlingi]
MNATTLSPDLHPLLTEYVLRLLNKKQVTTVNSFLNIESCDLAKIANLPPVAITTIKNHLEQSFWDSIYKGVSSNSRRRPAIATGITALDELLRGGLRLGHIYELCGESCAGKTQLCLTLAANVAFAHSNRPVYFFDTRSAFSAIRIQQILERKHKDLSEQRLAQTLDNIKVEHVFNPELLVQAVEQLVKTKRAEDDPAPALLIIDSLPSLWYLYHNAESIGVPFGLLEKLICALRQFGTQHSVAVLLVNITVQARDGAAMQNERRINSYGRYSAMGHYWESATGTRLCLMAKEEANDIGDRMVQVWKSSHLRTGAEAVIRITDEGVV